MNWYEDPKIVAMVIIWKFVVKPKLETSQIVDKIKQLGYTATIKSVKDRLSEWGCIHEAKIKTLPSFEEINKSLGIVIKSHKFPKPIKTKDELTLVISDIHSPFYRSDLIARIVHQYGINGATPCKRLVINADLFDCYSISRFMATRNVNIVDEFLSTISLVALLSVNFPEIILTSGNHEQRVFSYFMNHGIGIDKMFLVNYDWIKYVQSLFKNIKIGKNILGNTKVGKHEQSHCFAIGDCAVGHFEISGGTPLVAAKKVEEWINKWRVYVPELAKCKLILQSHTHNLSRAEIYGGDVSIGETGCMCEIQEYAVKPDAKYGPSVNGWWEVYQTNGVTDRNKSKYIIC